MTSRNKPAAIAAGVVALASVALAGCGASATVHHTQPYCYPSSKCAKATVVVEQCGGPSPGRCRVMPVASVSVFDAHGKLIGAESAGTGHEDRSFSFVEQAPGRYVFATTISGRQIRRAATLRLGHTVAVKLIQPIS